MFFSYRIVDIFNNFNFQDETDTAKDLKDILMAFKLNKPPPDITAELLFTKLETKLKENIQKEGMFHIFLHSATYLMCPNFRSKLCRQTFI